MSTDVSTREQVPFRLRTADGDTVEFVRSLYRGDRYRLVADLSQRRDRPLAAPLAVAVETP